MDPEKILDKINSEENVNDTISRDEENPAQDMPLAVKTAEELILQLPSSHEGRKEWLVRYGQSPEAKQLRQKD